jgi:hypothetical protein
MLPADTLSLHGYTKRWGFFSGTCRGARHRPFEVSKDLIECCIRGSEDAITSLQAERDDLLQPPKPETKAWMKVYVAHKHDGKNSYAWRKGTITEQPHQYGNGTDTFIVRDFLWTGDVTEGDAKLKCQPLTELIKSYEFPGVESVTGIIAALNHRYVRQVITPNISQHRQYVEWQRERIRDWAPKPLLPVANEREQALEAARAELEKAGCIRGRAPYGIGRPMGWWLGKRYLGRDVKSALKALKGR